MKLLKSLLCIFSCVCCLLLIAAGCQTQCVGIVKSFEIKDEYEEIKEGSMLFGIIESGYYPHLTVTFKKGVVPENYFCSQLTVYAYDFENYDVTNLDDLLSSAEFLNVIEEEHRIRSVATENGATLPTTFFGGTETLAYLLFYDFYEKPEMNPIIENLLDYAGYVKVK